MAADSHVDWRYSKCYLRSTPGAATFLAQNLLIVACSLCSSSYELNGLCAIFLWPYSRTPSRRYSFGLTAAPHHGNIHLALQPRPITAIFLQPYSRAPSGRYSFGLTAAPHPWRYFLRPCGHASRRLSIFLCLLARIDFIPPYGDSRLTAIIDFFLCLTARINFIPPYGNSRLTAIINFFFASRQESISFRLTAIRATRRY